MPPPAAAEAPSTSEAPGSVRAPTYRPDIDGLRALAVIAVVLFHNGVPGLDGGYVGVDVFFVISGYLITQLLEVAREESARRTLAAFYLRRIRRILPALFATCIVTAVIGAVLFLPDELVNLGKYLAATGVLLSNAASRSEGGYFAPWTQQLPLSHLWSIAVEEQFYLIYPLLLLAITRYLLPYRRATLTILALASLALCIWASHYKPVANYFAAPTRAWELLLGAALAIGRAPRIGNRIANDLVAAASLTCIALAVHLYTARTAYPGTAAILPCLATAVLISTGAGAKPAFVNRVLAWPPLVFLGLISYSLYLWHRPLLVFANYYHIAPLSAGATVLLLATTVLVAAASWRFIERPVRARTVLKTPRALLVAAAVGSAGILLAGLVLWNSDGFPQRFSREARALLVRLPGTPQLIRCLQVSVEDITAGRLCNDGPREGSAPKVLVWGDSHALALMPAYEALARAHHMHPYFVARSSCLPLLAPLHHPMTLAGAADSCTRFNEAVLEAITRLDPQLIILDGYWVAAGIPAGVTGIALGLEQTVRRVGNRARSICVVLGVPTLRYPGSYALVMAHRRNIADEFLTLSRADALAQYRDVDRDVRAIARGSGLRVADPKDALCPGESCLYKSNGRALYFDDSHLSAYGALYVAPALEPCFEPDRRP